MSNQTLQLQNDKMPIKVKLAAAWASLMSCYIYCDHFAFFVKDYFAMVSEGRMGPLGPATEQVLLGVSILMSIPSVMIFFSIILPPKVCKIANIVVASIYVIVQGLTMPGSALFYLFFSVVEISLLCAIIYQAWNWPKASIATAE